MGLLDNVKGLLADIHITLGNISKNRIIFINIENKSKNYEFNGENQFINLAKLGSKDEEKLKKIFQKAPVGTLIIDRKKAKLLKDVNSSMVNPNNSEILAFFNNKIPPEDFVILIASLVIRDKFQQGERVEVADLKMQLIRTYGEKANTITNLCTARYFEEFLIPLYREMAKSSSFTDDQYRTAYSKLINDFPTAIFINSRMTAEQVEDKIRSQIKKNKRYGVPILNIHGIGTRNINVIQKVINKLKYKDDYVDKKILVDEPTIIVRLRFNI